MVRIPINSQPIPAYSRVVREQMMNPAKGGLMFQNVPPASTVGMSIVGVDQNGSHAEGRVEAIKNVNDEVIFVMSGDRQVRHSQTFKLGGALMNVSSIIGRVVKRDKRAGLGFTESSFFPKGTPEGIAGATPTGMRAVTLDATMLKGVHALNAGDKIDLMASFPQNTAPSGTSLIIPGQPSQESDSNNGSEPRLLAQNALVLKPVYVRNEASTSASLTQGTRVQNIPKYEVAIAVDANDLIPLQSALNRSLPITCIARSMKPVDHAENKTDINRNSEVVSVPVTVKPVFAYSVVTRNAFVSPATRQLKLSEMKRSEADRLGVITSVNAAIGAIAKHDIPSGRYLRRSDLLSGPPTKQDPQTEHLQNKTTVIDCLRGHRTILASANSTVQEESQSNPNLPPPATVVGDRPAITKFVPPGRTAFAIPWNRIYGSEHLQIGDEIDLMASYSLENQRSEEETETRTDGTTIVRKIDSLSTRETQRTWGESFGFRAEPWFVASDATVIAPVGFPAPASALRALGGQLNRSRSSNARNGFDGPPIIIAVDDRDVESVAAALATRDALFTVAFHASEKVGPTLTPGSKEIIVATEPMSPYQEFNESIWRGNRRRITTRVVSEADKRFENAITADAANEYYGRVLARPLSRGEHLTPKSFMPVGTEPGLAAGVPQGHTFLPVADREIEGLDSFVTNDHVAILVRGIKKRDPRFAVAITSGFAPTPRPAASVVASDVRIARGSIAGQTILSVANKDLAVLQAAMVATQNTNSQLIAVVRPRSDASIEDEVVAAEKIPDAAFGPQTNVQFTETIIGGRRTLRAFAGAPK
ncbi:MAG: hypothetical protein AAGI63_12705 [Planctomycetota bacterium]